MFLLFLGLSALIASFVLPSNPNYPVSRVERPLRLGGIALMVLGLSTACIKQVDAGEVGVQKLFGQVQDRVLESGLNYVNPLVNIANVNVRTQNYTMSGVHDEGDRKSVV